MAMRNVSLDFWACTPERLAPNKAAPTIKLKTVFLSMGMSFNAGVSG